MPSNHLILCCPLLPPSIFPSIRAFSIESVIHIRWPTYWSFSFSIRPSNEYSGLISKIDWLDLLADQGTLKSLLQCHSSTAPILWLSAFFIVQLSHPYRLLEKPIYSKIQSIVTGIWEDPSHNPEIENIYTLICETNIELPGWPSAPDTILGTGYMPGRKTHPVVCPHEVYILVEKRDTKQSNEHNISNGAVRKKSRALSTFVRKWCWIGTKRWTDVSQN